MAGLVGTVLIAWLVKLRGTRLTLGLLGSLRVACTAIFVLHAAGFLSGYSLVFGAAALQAFIRYTELVALFTLFMGVSWPAQPGTDFTILACAQFTAYVAGSVISGRIADSVGYAPLFTTAALLSVLVVVATLRLIAKPGQTPLTPNELRPSKL
jgi:PAT family beta-lactamase induction signal transducer AmpG